MQRRLVFYNLD